MINDFKDLAAHLRHKLLFPAVRIAVGSRVSRDSAVGSRVTIDADCYVYHSRIGDRVHIQKGCSVFHCRLDNNIVLYPECLLGEVSVGSYSYIGDRSSVGHTSIGRFCSVGPHFICGYGEHPAHFVTTSPVFYSTSRQCGTSFVENNSFVEKREVSIGHDVWIGARVFVRDGVKIGNGAILAAGAVVVKDVADYSIVGGIPAQVLRLRFAEPVIARLLEVKWWEWEDERLRAAATLLGQHDVERFLEWASGGAKLPVESHCEARR